MQSKTETSTEFDLAMEAIAEYEILRSLKTSDELVCECHPVSYRQITEYLESGESKQKTLAEVLSTLYIARGCGTCLDKASLFVEMSRNQTREEDR